MKIPLEDFFNAYFECRKHKRNTYNALQFEVSYEENLIQLWQDVNNKTYVIGKSICFIIRRPKLREVFAANFRDRVVHHVIMQRLEPLFEKHFINDTYSCRKEKGVLYGVKRVYDMIKECSNNYTRSCWIAKLDMQGFFMTIHKPTLNKILQKLIHEEYFGDDKDILSYLVEIVINNCPHKNCIIKGNRKLWKLLPSNKSLFTCGDDLGLPIGNLTSQTFANYYLTAFDQLMLRKFKYYGRYVDDIIIVSDKQSILRFIPQIKDKLGEIQVVLHPNKFYLQHYTKGVKFIGAVIKPGRIYAANTTVSNMLEAVHKFNSFVDDIIHVRQSLNSYLGFLKHYSTYAIKFKMCMALNQKWYNVFQIDDGLTKFTLLQHLKYYKH